MIPPFETTTDAVPGLETNAAGTCAVKDDPAYDVDKVPPPPVPLHTNCDPLTKLLPYTVKTNPAEPAWIELGLNEEICGGGLVIWKGIDPEVPMELVTDTWAVPGLVSLDISQ